MIKILDWYIFKRFISTFFFILGIFCIVILVIDVSEKIDDFLHFRPPLTALLFDYYLNFIFFFGNLISPICVFLAVIFFTSRLAQNTEITAILASGVNFYRLMMPYVFAALLLTGMIFYLKAYLVPKADVAMKEFENTYLGKERPMKDLNIHRKVATNKEEGSETYVYFFSYNQLIHEGYIFYMEKIMNGDIVNKISCEKINWDKENERWTLSNCIIRELTMTTEKLTVRARIDTTFLLKPTDINVKDIRPESMNLEELNDYIKLEQERGSDILSELTLEKYRRYAYPFAALVLTIIGFSVSTKKQRGGTALLLGLGLIISFVFVVLVVVGETLFGESIPAWLRVWYPNITFFLIGIVLLRLAPK